jgi:formate hydrogenlyase subunit 3/multisubunit Na+/H+ antiporter MnhD subunit
VNALLWLAPLVPFLASFVALADRRARWVGVLAPIAAVPALFLSLLGPPVTITITPVLLGVELRLDEVGAIMLFAAAFLWATGSWFASRYLAEDPARHRFTFWWLLAMAGNVGLIVAGDAATFYAAFAVMTFSAYGLVVHERGAFALRAGRIYIVMAVAGELLLLAGVFLAVWAAGGWDLEAIPRAVARSPQTTTIVVLLLAGFGVKAGVVLLHMWLPLAHPAAPVPASAVLSGCMIKAGLLGWLRFLPIGESALPDVGVLVVAAGFLAAFGAVVVGLFQHDIKVNLAYSSVSQMGIMTAIVGVGLVTPEAGGAVLLACAVYALHHGLAKGALFLGVGVVRSGREATRRIAIAAMVLPALALAAAPISSGAAAKGLLKGATGSAPTSWVSVPFVLSLTSVATTLLMARMLALATADRPHGPGHRGLGPPWVIVLGAVVAATWLVPAARSAGVTTPTLAGTWEQVWPVLVGIGLAGLGWIAVRRPAANGQRSAIAARLLGHEPLVPPGDVVVPIEAAARWLAWVWRRGVAPRAAAAGARVRRLEAFGFASLTPGPQLEALERHLIRWSTAGLLVMVLVVVVAVVLRP